MLFWAGSVLALSAAPFDQHMQTLVDELASGLEAKSLKMQRILNSLAVEREN